VKIVVDENDFSWQQHSDRRSTDLISESNTPAHAGLSVGVAEYTSTDYGPLQRHEDQEAVYCVSGRGTIRVGDEEYDMVPGRAVYVGRGVAHATKRTGPEPVKVVYIHAPD